MDALYSWGRPQRVMLLVMVDRGHRELPIQPDFCGKKVPTSKIESISLRLNRVGTRLIQAADIPTPIEKQEILLIDDVIYTGRTIRAAMDALYSWGRPQRIMLLVMVDRGHRELPIQPDFCGKKVPTSSIERISLRLNNIDNEEGVFLE